MPVSPAPVSAGQNGEPIRVKPHSVWQAVILSIFVPGTGSIINDRPGKGVLIMCCYVAAIVIEALERVPFLIVAAWSWGVAAAYIDARRWNRVRGIPN